MPTTPRDTAWRTWRTWSWRLEATGGAVMPSSPPPASHAPTDLQRITTIGDSVFAVALTLLAVGIRVPPELIGKSLTAADLVPMLSDMGAVVLSFCVASVFWLGHWLHLRQVIRTTVPFLIAN